jgi:Tfp pilus assembly protein PilZ
MVVSEKRKSDRKPCFFYADYAYKGRVYRDFIKNISTGGAFIETINSIPLGQELVLTYSEPVSTLPVKTSPGGQEILVTFSKPVSTAPVKKTGSVAWVGPDGFGIKFKTKTTHYSI